MPVEGGGGTARGLGSVACLGLHSCCAFEVGGETSALRWVFRVAFSVGAFLCRNRPWVYWPCRLALLLLVVLAFVPFFSFNLALLSDWLRHSLYRVPLHGQIVRPAGSAGAAVHNLLQFLTGAVDGSGESGGGSPGRTAALGAAAASSRGTSLASNKIVASAVSVAGRAGGVAIGSLAPALPEASAAAPTGGCARFWAWMMGCLGRGTLPSAVLDTAGDTSVHSLAANNNNYVTNVHVGCCTEQVSIHTGTPQYSRANPGIR